MAYQSKHTGDNIDAGISINDTQNNRLVYSHKLLNYRVQQNLYKLM